MPRVNGLDVLDWLKQNPQFATFPVVVMSGLGETKQVDRAYNLGARSFLSKPINADDVRATLEKLQIPIVG